MKPITKEFRLTDDSVDRISETIAGFFENVPIDRRELTRLRLSAENVLLRWQTVLGAAAEVTLVCGRRFGDWSVILRCPGDECNPLKEDDAEAGMWAKSLQDSLRTAPTFDYFSRVNSVRFLVKRKHFSRVLQSVICIALGITLGYVGMYLPEAFRTEACENVFTPLYETYLNVIGLSGIPLIFLSMVTGILGVGDIHSFSVISRKMVMTFLVVILACVAGATLLGLPFFSFNFSGTGVDLDYTTFIDMFLGWFPTGLFQPFINCDAMQLIILGAGFGVALLILNGCSGHLVNMIYDVNAILLRFCRWLAALIPPFVCIMIVKSMWSSGVAQLLSAWKSWVVTTGMQLLVMAALLLMLALKNRIPIPLILKRISKTFLIALGTNSCSVTISEIYSCCDTMGVSPKIFSFGIPIGTSVYKPATAVRLVILCFFMAAAYQVPVSPGWFFMLMILAVALSIAIPAIPGGTLMFCTMMFTKLNIPTEVLTQMLATDVFFDCVCTAFNQISVELTLAGYAGRVGLLDKKKASAGK